MRTVSAISQFVLHRPFENCTEEESAALVRTRREIFHSLNLSTMKVACSSLLFSWLYTPAHVTAVAGAETAGGFSTEAKDEAVYHVPVFSMDQLLLKDSTNTEYLQALQDALSDTGLISITGDTDIFLVSVEKPFLECANVLIPRNRTATASFLPCAARTLACSGMVLRELPSLRLPSEIRRSLWPKKIFFERVVPKPWSIQPKACGIWSHGHRTPS